jgi:hypothetical protein
LIRSKKPQPKEFNMADNYHVSLAFATYSDPSLDNFAAGHVICMTGNAAFPNPTVKPADMDLLQVAFHNALLAAANGGTQLTAAKNEARDSLVAALRQNAAYVQGRPGLTLSMLLSSGFLSNSTNHAQTELDPPVLVSIDNGDSGQLIAHLSSVANAHDYQVKVLTPDGKELKTVDSTQARSVLITGLTPGVVYTLLARAVGGSTGYSDWSDPVSHMCM